MIEIVDHFDSDSISGVFLREMVISPNWRNHKYIKYPKTVRSVRVVEHSVAIDSSNSIQHFPENLTVHLAVFYQTDRGKVTV